MWCEQDGYGLDRDVLFTPDNIDRYIEHGANQYSDGSRATRRSALRRMARQLTTTAPWAPLPEQIPRQTRHAPYTVAEVDGYRSLTQSTPLLQRRLHATLALGLGAGLWAREYYTARPEDLTVEDGISWLQVHGSKARRVPVRRPFAEWLHEIARDDPKSTFFGCSVLQTDKSRLYALLRDLSVPGWLPPLETERLRSTWLVHQLQRRAPIPELLQAAGLVSTTAITHLLPHLAPSPPGFAAALMADHS